MDSKNFHRKKKKKKQRSYSDDKRYKHIEDNPSSSGKHKKQKKTGSNKKKKKKKTKYSVTASIVKNYQPKLKYGKKNKHNSSSSTPLSKKLGPIDIGRSKYKGTKYKESKYNFLDEKVHRHARSFSFNERKKANPVSKKPTLSEIGTPNSWTKPSFYKLESDKLGRIESRLDFLKDTKPLHVRDRSLDKLKDVRVPKGTFAQQEMAPFTWKPIDYELKEDGAHFLNDKYWYESSQIDVDYELSHLLQTLPPERLLYVKDIPPPTGYESKLNYLNQLRKIVNAQQKIEKTNNLLNVPLSAVNESSDDDESEISKLSDFATNIANDEEMKDTLNEILHDNDSKYNDDDMDKRMEDALKEILAPSPSPPDPGNIKNNKKKIATKKNNEQIDNKKNALIEINDNKKDEIIHDKNNEIASNDVVMTSEEMVYIKTNMEDLEETHDISPLSGQKQKHKQSKEYKESTNDISIPLSPLSPLSPLPLLSGIDGINEQYGFDEKNKENIPIESRYIN